MPASVRLISIEKGPHSMAETPETVTVNVEVQTQDINNISLRLQVPSSQTADKVLVDASNRLMRFADEIKKALEGGLHF
jgi:hypothetical protein